MYEGGIRLLRWMRQIDGKKHLIDEKSRKCSMNSLTQKSLSEPYYRSDWCKDKDFAKDIAVAGNRES